MMIELHYMYNHIAIQDHCLQHELETRADGGGNVGSEFRNPRKTADRCRPLDLNAQRCYR